MTQDDFGFFEATCFSAALNALFADPFVDVPDLAPLNETGCLFACHDNSPNGFRTPVAGYILLRYGVQFKSVESNTLYSDRYFGQIRPDLSVESVSIHAEIKRCIPQSDESG